MSGATAISTPSGTGHLTRRKIEEHNAFVRTGQPFEPRETASDSGLLCLAAYVILADVDMFTARFPSFTAALRAARVLRAEWVRLNRAAFTEACRLEGVVSADVAIKLPTTADWETFALQCAARGIRFEPLDPAAVEAILHAAEVRVR
jgi:hypothetical protein